MKCQAADTLPVDPRRRGTQNAWRVESLRTRAPEPRRRGRLTAATRSSEVPGSWQLGWAVGGAVALIAAGLLLTIIGLARRIAGQASEIEDAIDAARENTAPLFDISAINLSLDQIARRLHAMREDA